MQKQKKGPFVIMGVAGCGKSTIGAGIAQKIGGQYFDGDDLHPAANIAKMSKGEALNDIDRFPWLDEIGNMLGAKSNLTFIGCSALKRIYRDRIIKGANRPVCFIYLQGSKELIGERMAQRTGHFMPTSLLDSQFAALQPPCPDENHITIDIAMPFDGVVNEILRQIKSNE